MNDKFEYNLTPYQDFLDETIAKYNIKIKHVDAEPTDPSFAYPDQNTIFINDMYDSNISPIFITAHEVYHVTHKSSDQKIYAFSPLAKITEEKNAHLFAIRLFFKSTDEDYVPNYIAVMFALGLPFSMEHLVRKVWAEYSNQFWEIKIMCWATTLKSQENGRFSMSSLFTAVFLVSIVWFFVSRRKDKKKAGKVTKKTWYILILTAISFVIVGVASPKQDTESAKTPFQKQSPISNEPKTSTSSVEKEKPIKSGSSKSSSVSKSKQKNKEKSIKSASSVLKPKKEHIEYNFSKVEYNMTIAQVINAVGKQPTDKSDNEIYYGNDDFDFNDGKLIGSSVKSIQNKKDNEFKKESSTRTKIESEKSNRKSQAQYFGTRSVEYVQKHPSAYNSGKIDNSMRYMYMIDKGDYLVRYDTDDGYTNVYSYDGNSENKLGDHLYTAKTIFNQPATKKYYYISDK